MSEQNTQSTTPEEWLDTRVKERVIKCFDYSNFTDFQNIGEGGFGAVKRATYRIADSDPMTFALKSIKKLTNNQEENQVLLDFIKEVNTCFVTNSFFDNI